MITARQSAIDAVRPHLLFEASRSLLDHWQQISEPGTLPDRRDIDPIAITSALPRMFLIDVVPETHRLRYRLAGEEINSRYNHSIVGQHLDEITPQDVIERVSGYFLACPNGPALVLLSGILFAERENPSYGERLLLPLRDRETGEMGLAGITLESKVFPDQASARARATRTLMVAPLDGSAITETEHGS